ncbi:MAG: TetR/AcrR family transcriptional regulator [Sphaerochaetaceae bacterium]
MPKAEYRSSIRSKNLIKEAAIELLSEKKWDKITVTDIVTKADINRGTFYAHYSNPLAMFKSIEEEVVQRIINALTSYPILDVLKHPGIMLSQVKNCIENNPKAVKVFFSSDISSQLLIDHKKHLGDHFVQETRTIEGIQDRDNFEIVLRILLRGILDSYIAQISGNMGNATLESVTTMAEWLARNAFKPYLPANQ